MVEFHPLIKVLGDPILKNKAKEVDCLDDSFFKLCLEMQRLMHEADGIGIAANQVGSDLAVFITRAEGKDDIVINPEILEMSDKLETFQEGCLSIPGVFCNSHNRFNKIKVRYRSSDNINEVVERELCGIPAVVFQHETDHLNGKLYIDHYGPLARSMALQKHKKYMKNLNKKPIG